MKEVKYIYKNCPVPGGGYVTGFLYHPVYENILYIRTDIGGMYKYNYNDSYWESLSETVNATDLAETYPAALAVDFKDKDSLYVVSGIYPMRNNDKRVGKFSISRDGGRSFVHKEMPFFVHGNYSGRGSGLRLVRHPFDENTFFYASQMDGLYKTCDLGDTWERLSTNGELGMTFVWCAPCGNTIIAGSAGIETGNDEARGCTLQVSYDGGASFEPLCMPEKHVLEGSKLSGLVPHRYDYDGRYLYVTFNQTAGAGYNIKYAYSCDSGKVIGGRVLRYSFDENMRVTEYEDITPDIVGTPDGVFQIDKSGDYDFGFGGVCTSPVKEGVVVISSLCHESGDMIYLSRDYGESWELILYNLSIGNMHFNTSYMKPEYNNNASLIHWLSDIKINPFNPDELWFNTGTGVFRCLNLLSDDRSFEDWNDGLEQTVHVNVYSPVDGPVKVIDMIGDLGGFAFTELDKQCENSFANSEKHRYITCINADASDIHPNVLVATARGNWIGKSKGGLILSRDYGQTFERLKLPYGISEYIDALCRCIEQPNVNAGYAALSPDTRSIVYSVSDNGRLKMKGLVVSNDNGNSFAKSRIFSCNGDELTYSDTSLKVFSDRVRSNVFYGFGDDLDLYISTDSGACFRQLDVKMNMEGLRLADIHLHEPVELRPENGKSGIFYCALNKYGLIKLSFDSEQMTVQTKTLSRQGDVIYRVGLGLLHEDKSFLEDDKALFVTGIIDGVYGIYRSFDEGVSFQKINDESQGFGDIMSICGDSRCVGRVFLATGSFGLKYGEPDSKE